MVRENALEQGQGRSREIVLFGLFTALIAIGAFIRIPVPVCPFTLQLLFTTLAGLLLGSRKGALSVALYVLLGLVGVPVFTEGGGPSYIFQPTFGYLVGFIAGAWLTGKLREMSGSWSFGKVLFANLCVRSGHRRRTADGSLVVACVIAGLPHGFHNQRRYVGFADIRVGAGNK